MKLSILIPVYNAQDYIQNCLNSLVCQDLSKSEYEIILIDDGSMDNSLVIIQNFAKQHRNIFFETQTNIGCYSTRNKLLKLAKGNYIYFLDADDYISPNCLKKLVGLAENFNLDILGFETKETLKLDDLSMTGEIDFSNLIILNGKIFLRDYKKIRHEVWWYFIKREYVLQNQFTFNNKEYNSDVIFTLKLLYDAKRLGFLRIKLHRYVQSQYSLMRNKNRYLVARRLHFMGLMIVDKSKFILNIKAKNRNNNVLLDNLSYRRDVFVFFNILNTIRNPIKLNILKDRIQLFKSVDAYPIKKFIGDEYGSIKHKVVLVLINFENLLYTLVKIKNLFFRINRLS